MSFIDLTKALKEEELLYRFQNFLFHFLRIYNFRGWLIFKVFTGLHTVIIFIKIAFAFRNILRSTQLMNDTVRFKFSYRIMAFLSYLISQIFIESLYLNNLRTVVFLRTPKVIFKDLLFFVTHCIVNYGLGPSSPTYSTSVTSGFSPFQDLPVYRGDLL